MKRLAALILILIMACTGSPAQATLYPITNFGVVTASAGYDSTATTLVLTAGHGVKLPSTFPFILVWFNSTDYAGPHLDPNVEIIEVSNRSTDTLTVVRGREGTTAVNHHTAGKTYTLYVTLTKGLYDRIETDIAAAAAMASGIGGSVGPTANMVPVASGTGGATVQPSTCSVIAGKMACPDGYESTGPGPGRVILGEDAWPGAGDSAGKHSMEFDSTDSLLKSQEFGGSLVTYYSTANAPIMDAWYDVAGCNNATAGPVLNLPPTNAAVPACDSGTNQFDAYLGFNDTTDQATYFKRRLGLGFSGSQDFVFRFKMASATTGTVGLCAQLVRIPTGGVTDIAFPVQAAGNCVSVTVPGTAGFVAEATLTGATCTSYVAGDMIAVRISRDADASAVADSATGDLRLMGFTYRAKGLL